MELEPLAPQTSMRAKQAIALMCVRQTAARVLKHGAGDQKREREMQQIAQPSSWRRRVAPLPRPPPVGGGVGNDRGAGGDGAEHADDEQPEGAGFQRGLVGDAGQLGCIGDGVVFFFGRHGSWISLGVRIRNRTAIRRNAAR